MIKKYYKNFGIIAGMITTANINKAGDTGEVTIVLDGVEYISTFKLDIDPDENWIYFLLSNNSEEFTNNGEQIKKEALSHVLITNIEGEGYTYDDKAKHYNFSEGKPLKIYLKSIDYKIEYTGEKHFEQDYEKKFIDYINNSRTIKEFFEEMKDYFKDGDCGSSKINNEGKDSTKMFKEIDNGEFKILIDSSKIADDKFRTFIVDADNVKFIEERTLQVLNEQDLDFNKYKNIGVLKNSLKCWKFKKGNAIITGPFKIKIDGTGNEIPSTEDSTDLTKAEFIRLIADKNTINPYFLQKDFKFDIIGGKDNYIISDEDINKIQESLNNLKNTEEVTQITVINELKKLEKDIFVENGITIDNVKCYKDDSNTPSDNDLGTDITVKIDSKAINPDKIKIKIKITLGDIKNSENISLDSAVVSAINDKLKAVKYGITVKEILAILNDNALKSYFTEALVDADILNKDGTVLTTPITQNSVIKFKVDKLKSEYFKKTQNKSKEENQNGEGQKDEGPKAKKCCGSN